MRRTRRRCLLWLSTAFSVLIVAMILVLYRSGANEPSTRPAYDGPSAGLVNTKVVPTLDTPVIPQRNVLWCASFVAAWKVLEAYAPEVARAYADRSETCRRLVAAPDPASHIPPECLYVRAGKSDEGIGARISSELQERFPKQPAPCLAGIPPGGYVAYAFLQTSQPFTVPYFDNREPMQFTDGLGRRTPVRSFGIRAEDAFAYERLRRQVDVLYIKGDPFGMVFEFALDLCKDSVPNQVVVARIPLRATLAETINDLNERIRTASENATEERARRQGLIYNDVVLVPSICWRVLHRFKEIEAALVPGVPPIISARQDMWFQLDRSGVELSSEAKIIVSPIPIHFVLDKPFLIVVRRRGMENPFFVMWVDNAELLEKWDTDGAS